MRGKCFFDYNYFDDDGCEAACYDLKTGKVGSNKIAFGWCDFSSVAIAMYILLEFYTEEYSLTGINGDIVENEHIIGWLNYLFDEKFVNQRLDDPWKVYSVLRKEDEAMADKKI